MDFRDDLWWRVAYPSTGEMPDPGREAEVAGAINSSNTQGMVVVKNGGRRRRRIRIEE